MSFRNDFSPEFEMPHKMRFFKEQTISEIIALPDCSPNISTLLKMLTSANIESFKLIETRKSTSNEGQRLTGYKLLIKVKIKEKIMYIADKCTKPVHAIHQEDIVTLFAVLPKNIDNVDICDLIKNNNLIITPFVLSSDLHKIDKKTIHKCVLLLLNITSNLSKKEAS